MAFTNPWDESDPPGAQAANTADDEIRQTKLDVRERIETVLPGWTDDLEDPKEFPGWIVEKGDSVLVADSTVDNPSWTIEDRDTDAYITVPSTTVTIPAGLAGLYLVGASMAWGPSALGRRDFTMRLNAGSLLLDRRNGLTGVSTYNKVGSRLIFLSVGDAIDFTVFQTSGGGLFYGNIDLNSNLVYFYGIRLGG